MNSLKCRLEDIQNKNELTVLLTIAAIPKQLQYISMTTIRNMPPNITCCRIEVGRHRISYTISSDAIEHITVTVLLPLM